MPPARKMNSTIVRIFSIDRPSASLSGSMFSMANPTAGKPPKCFTHIPGYGMCGIHVAAAQDPHHCHHDILHRTSVLVGRAYRLRKAIHRHRFSRLARDAATYVSAAAVRMRRAPCSSPCDK
jgi:hypothetical protein